MTTPNPLKVSELEFSKIKENLKTYLRGQSQFSDYDFDGSSLSIILDLLAYATHYNVSYSNLAFGETFLDSAIQRSSVVSRAKELGYTPKSMSASRAVLNISFTLISQSPPAEFVLPKGTRFQGTAINGVNYNFVTTTDYIVENDGNGVFSEQIEVYQGKYTEYQYAVNLNDASQRIIIPAKNVDKKFLTVSFKENANITEWSLVYNINDLSLSSINSTTNLYMLQETYDGFYELIFGDDIIGKAIDGGNVIRLQYLITDGALSNGVKIFSLNGNISGVATMSISREETSAGGAERETIESIKYMAPFFYQAQGRAVTESDYKALVGNNYGDIDDISVWGGEKNDPPFYGKVFIAVKPRATTYLSAAIKQNIQNDILSKYNIVGIRPEVVNPDYIHVNIDSTIIYNSRLYSGENLDSLVRDAIEIFFDTEANKFGKTVYYSGLVSAISATSGLILSNITNYSLEKSLEIFTGISGQYKYAFNNSLHPGAMKSNQITIGGIDYFLNDIKTAGTVTGTIGIYRLNDSNQIVYLSQNIGTINYNTGEIVINNLKIDSTDNLDNYLTITVSPGTFIDLDNPDKIMVDNNIYSNGRNQIVTLNSITLNLIPDTAE